MYRFDEILQKTKKVDDRHICLSVSAAHLEIIIFSRLHDDTYSQTRILPCDFQYNLTHKSGIKSTVINKSYFTQKYQLKDKEAKQIFKHQYAFLYQGLEREYLILPNQKLLQSLLATSGQKHNHRPTYLQWLCFAEALSESDRSIQLNLYTLHHTDLVITCEYFLPATKIRKSFFKFAEGLAELAKREALKVADYHIEKDYISIQFVAKSNALIQAAYWPSQPNPVHIDIKYKSLVKTKRLKMSQIHQTAYWIKRLETELITQSN